MSLNGSRSWLVAVICSVLNFLHLGMARLSGSLYLAVLERYQVDRSKASLPFVLCYGIRNVSGPLVGYLATKFGIYIVTFSGGLLAFVGIGCCYFAEDIFVVVLCWGVVFGFGFGMGSMLIPEILNHHFEKYLSNANGVAFGGECIAGFVLPMYLKFSLGNYGTSGTFLILSGMMLNSIPATLLLKYLSKGKTAHAHEHQQSNEHLMGKNGLYCSINGSNSKLFEKEDDEIPLETTRLVRTKESTAKYCMPSDIRSRNATESNIFKVENLNVTDWNALSTDLKFSGKVANQQENERNTIDKQPGGIQTRSSSNLNPKTTFSQEKVSHSYPKHYRKYKYTALLKTDNSIFCRPENQSVPVKSYASLEQRVQESGSVSDERNGSSNLLMKSNEKSSISHSISEVPTHFPDVGTSAMLPPSSSTLAQSSSNPFRIFLNPAFCMILLTQSTMLYNATMLWTIIVDFSRDVGLSSKEEIYILTCLSVFDMIGRLSLGWITDSGYVANSTFSAICCFGMSTSVGTLVFLRRVATIGCSVSLFGLCFGGFLIVCPGVVNEHIQPDKRRMALASRFFLFAPMSLSQSLLIGHFREKLGSYNLVFIIVAVLCLLSSVTSLLTPYAEKCRRRRKRKGELRRDRNLNSATSAAATI